MPSSRPGTGIRLDSERGGGMVSVLEDNGRGIPEDCSGGVAGDRGWIVAS